MLYNDILVSLSSSFSFVGIYSFVHSIVETFIPCAWRYIQECYCFYCCNSNSRYQLPDTNSYCLVHTSKHTFKFHVCKRKKSTWRKEQKKIIKKHICPSLPLESYKLDKCVAMWWNYGEMFIMYIEIFIMHSWVL